MNTLRKLTGPGRREIWRQVSSDIGARYEDGGFWHGDKIVATHGDWSIVLDKYFCAASKIDYTRLRALFVSRDGFRFTVYRTGLFSDLAKVFGMQDVEVGWGEFDHDFIIKGSDSVKLRQLFQNRKIRDLISAQRSIHLSIRKRKSTGPTIPEGETFELHFHTPGVIKEVVRLKGLFELFGEVLQELCRMGSVEAIPNRSTTSVGA